MAVIEKLYGLLESEEVANKKLVKRIRDALLSRAETETKNALERPIDGATRGHALRFLEELIENTPDEKLIPYFIRKMNNIFPEITPQELNCLKSISDDDLLRASQSVDLFSVAESNRRLKEALKAEERVIKWLTVVLVFLTVVLIWRAY